MFLKLQVQMICYIVHDVKSSAKIPHLIWTGEKHVMMGNSCLGNYKLAWTKTIHEQYTPNLFLQMSNIKFTLKDIRKIQMYFS